MRIVQQGDGATRPLVLVYHLAEANDAALRLAAPGALIVNDTRTDHYVALASLDTTIEFLTRDTGAHLSPVILAGFSEGGLVTKRLLDMGADPDALVIADGTYGSDYASWTKYAARAKRRERAMLASYSAGTDKPWRGLRAVTGFDLKYGAELAQPMKYEEGSLAVLGYGDGDHSKQGSVVLPKMIAAAMAATAPVLPPSRPATVVANATGLVVAVGVVALGLGALALWRFRPGVFATAR